MKSLRQRKADKLSRENGWGELRTWPVPRAGLDPLIFQLRLPLTMDLVDLDDLAAGSPGAPDVVSEGVGEIAGVAQAAGLIVVGAIREHKPDQEPELLATLTVAFPGLSEPPDMDELATESPEDVQPPIVERLSDQVIRLERFTRILPPGAEEYHPHLLVEYFLQTRFGGLVMAYATADPGMIFGGGGRDLYYKITETMFLGTRPMF